MGKNRSGSNTPIYIAQLYAWLAANKIDIDYGPGQDGSSPEVAIVQRVVKQLSSQLIDPAPELLKILDNISAEEIAQ